MLDCAGTWGGESAKFWLQVLTELENRGIADVFLRRLRPASCAEGLAFHTSRKRGRILPPSTGLSTHSSTEEPTPRG